LAEWRGSAVARRIESNVEIFNGGNVKREQCQRLSMPATFDSVLDFDPTSLILITLNTEY